MVKAWINPSMLRFIFLLIALFSFTLGYGVRYSLDRLNQKQVAENLTSFLQPKDSETKPVPESHARRQFAGRVDSSDQAASTPQVSKSEVIASAKIEEKQQSLSELERKIKDLGSDQADQQRLTELSNSLREAQLVSQNLEQEQNREKAQTFQNFANETQNFQISRVEQESRAQALKDQIHTQEGHLQNMTQQLRAGSEMGIITDELRSIQIQLPQERQKLVELQKQLRATQVQAGTASTLFAQKSKSQHEDERSRIQSQYEQPAKDLQARIQKLQTDYQSLMDSLPSRIEQRKQLLDQYDREKQALQQLQAQRSS